jgi:hypothetical protein
MNDRISKSLLDAGDRVWSEGCQRCGPFINASAGVIIGQGAKVGPPVVFCFWQLIDAFGNSTLAISATTAPRRR